MTEHDPVAGQATTRALQRVLAKTLPRSAVLDFLFLEQWERDPMPGPASALRIKQIRRANPDLAAAIRLEAATGR